MTKGFITFHIVNDIPWSNLNRDDSGTPKRTVLGGVDRGLLSSQSIKRAIRKDYEARILQLLPDLSLAAPGGERGAISSQASVRSRYTAEWVARRAEVIAADRGLELDAKKARSFVNSVVKKLVGGEETIIWLSVEELEALAALVVEEKQELTKDDLDSVIADGKSGALAIAAFGRMFANSNNKNTDAAIAVSPAISTHENLIETDYFIAADDFGFFAKSSKGSDAEVVENYAGAGAGHLGVALYTSGIFYRTVTIDVKDLLANWTGASSKFAELQLRQLVRSIVNSLPTGKKNSTAPYTTIPLVIAETQSYREAYSIADPVLPLEDGGFLKPTVESIAIQHARAREFNSDNYGEPKISGSLAELITSNPSTMDELIDYVVGEILSQRPGVEVSEDVEVADGELTISAEH